MTKKIIAILALLFISFIAFQFFYGGNPDDIKPVNNFEVVAHKGVHQNYDLKRIDPQTNCIATHIFKPKHDYLENTIESIEAAYNYGATIVEIDINRSSDDHIILFHDQDLGCLTNGKGKINDHPLEYLKNLDIGFGYTFDNGKTYPFRGKGIGKMPTLIEVLKKFPDKKFLIDHKDGSLKTAELLVHIFETLPLEQQQLLFYWGPDSTFEYINKNNPSIRRLFCNKKQLKKWMLTYFITFGSKGFPKESNGFAIGLLPKYTKFLWGWPYLFLSKINDAGATFYLLVDSEEDAKKYANFHVDGIVTDYIEVVGKYFKDKDNSIY